MLNKRIFLVLSLLALNAHVLRAKDAAKPEMLKVYNLTDEDVRAAMWYRGPG